MTILRFSMQGEDFLSVLMASVVSLHFSTQKEDNLEHTNGMCPLCTLKSTCRPVYMQHWHAPHKSILLNIPPATILVSALEHHVS